MYSLSEERVGVADWIASPNVTALTSLAHLSMMGDPDTVSCTKQAAKVTTSL